MTQLLKQAIQVEFGVEKANEIFRKTQRICLESDADKKVEDGIHSWIAKRDPNKELSKVDQKIESFLQKRIHVFKCWHYWFVEHGLMLLELLEIWIYAVVAMVICAVYERRIQLEDYRAISPRRISVSALAAKTAFSILLVLSFVPIDVPIFVYPGIFCLMGFLGALTLSRMQRTI